MESQTHFSTRGKISSQLLSEVAEAIKDKYYGSVEIYIQDSTVAQITERVIKTFNNNGSRKW